QSQINTSQQELFPIQIEFSSSNFAILKAIWEEVKWIGFDISEFGKNTISINGVPADTKEKDYQKLFENIIEQFKNNKDQLNLDTKESVARSMARNMSINRGRQLSNREITQLTDELFACSQPEYLPNGKRTFITVTLTDLEKQFK
ncbi:MAG: hypothetical protein ABF258_02405, partial [Flavobacteriales bacterium]